MKKLNLVWLLLIAIILMGTTYLGSQYILDRDGDYLKIDGSTGSIQSMNFSDHSINEGDYFSLAAYDADLDIADSIAYILTTPNTTAWSHIVLEVYGSLKTLMEIHETTTHNNNSEQTAYNNNRNSTDTTALIIYTSYNDGADGTLIYSEALDGATLTSQRWVLKQNTKYSIIVSSLEDNNVVSSLLSWYDKTDIN